MEKNTFSDGTAYEQFMGRWTRAAGATLLDWIGRQSQAWVRFPAGWKVISAHASWIDANSLH